MLENKRFWWSLIWGLCLVTAVGLLSFIGAFRSSNLTLMDQMFLWFQADQNTPPIIIIEQLDRGESPVSHQDLIQSLSQYNPRSVYIIAESPSTVKQWQAVFNQFSVEGLTWRIASFNSAFDNDQLNQMGLIQTHMLAGHYRDWTDVQSDIPIFQANFLQKESPDNRIIDYTMGGSFIPKITDRQVQSRDVPQEIIADKIVIIGKQLLPGQPGFSVPFKSDQGISLTELQGYILHSALAGRFITLPSVFLTLLGGLAIVLIAFVALQWLRFVNAIIVVSAGALILLISDYWMVAQFAQMMPVIEWLVIAMLSLFGVYQLKRHKEELVLSGLVAETNAKLSMRIQPQHFNESEHPWQTLISFVNQQLNLNKSIFLEKVTKDHRVKEIISINCEISDIAEPRRDYQRPPYSVALEAGGPSQPFRGYFSNSAEGELEYLTPLAFGGEVLGFWAATLTPDQYWNQQAFENNMRGFADQIGELLYHRKYWQLREIQAEKFWVKVLAMEGGANLHTQIKQSVKLLENRLDILERVFNRMSTAALLYNVFGQIMQMNAFMERLAKLEDRPIYGYTATDMLANVCCISLDEARKKIRYVVLKHQAITLEASAFSRAGAFLLNIKPILSHEGDESTLNVSPFQVLGILFEFIDVSEIKEKMLIRQNLMQEYFHLLRNDVATIGLALGRVVKMDDHSKRMSFKKIIDEKLKSITEKTSEAEAQVDNFTGLMDVKDATINLSHLVNKMVDECKADAEAADVNLHAQMPQLSSLVLCEPAMLSDLFRLGLLLLIEDASAGSVINIFVYEEAENNCMLLHFDSSGMGMDMEQLNRVLESHQTYVDSSDPIVVQFAVRFRQLKSSGGKISVKSEIGSGFSIDIWLPLYKFMG